MLGSLGIRISQWTAGRRSSYIHSWTSKLAAVVSKAARLTGVVVGMASALAKRRDLETRSLKESVFLVVVVMSGGWEKNTS